MDKFKYPFVYCSCTYLAVTTLSQGEKGDFVYTVFKNQPEYIDVVKNAILIAGHEFINEYHHSDNFLLFRFHKDVLRILELLGIEILENKSGYVIEKTRQMRENNV